MSSASDFVDRARRLLPDEELEWLALLGSRAVGVNIAAMGIRVAGGSEEGLGSSSIGAASVGADEVVDEGVCMGGGNVLATGAGPGSLLPAAAAASALASFSALVGRPRFLFGGGSVGDG